MPTITVSRKEFEKLSKSKLPEKELRDRIGYLGTDLDDITKDEITVEIFPNRPDMLSVQGFARAFSSFTGKETGLREYKVLDSKEEVIIDRSVKDVRPFTACAIVKGISYDDDKIREVIQLQEKLHVTYGRNRRKVAIGIYPFEKIRPPIKFLARKPNDIKFQPLEFSRPISASQILKTHPAGRDYAHLLEGLKTYPLFIDADDKILSMPPIVNSHSTGKITEKTRDVFIECSGFDFAVIEKCLNIIVCALAEMGGRIYSMKLRYPDRTYTTPNLKPSAMKLDLGFINKWLGLELKEKEAKKYLEKMGYGYKAGKAMIPAYRADILHQVDLAEDMAIAYGYDQFVPAIPNVATIGRESPFEAFKSKVADILAGLGLLEVNTYNLTNREFQCKKMEVEMPLIELANSLSSEYDVLRAWVTPSMLEIFRNNKHHDYPQKIFGIGTVFRKNTKFETNIEENDRLCVALCSDRTDFTEIRQVLDYLFRQIDISYDVVETVHNSFINGRVGRVVANSKKVAYVGEISPVVLGNFNLEMPVTLLELNLTELFSTLKY